jgi:MFS family permease
MSILGNEFALRIGRSKVIYFFMALSGLGACCLGFTAGLPIAVVFVLMFIHYGLMLGDSATLTAGAIGSAPTHLRGSVLAIYSFVGFSAALVAPITFGLVLDYAGGNQSTQAWGLAFMSIGVFGALSPLARWGFKRFS